MKKRCIIKGLPKAEVGGNMPFYKQQAFGNRVNYSTNDVNLGYYGNFMSNPEIGKSIKEVDRKDATIEAEEGEGIFKSGGEYYNIHGKPHSKGGTPIIAEPGDFIFSNTKDMKIKGDALMFIDPTVKEKSKEYKQGKTPAELVKRFGLDKINDYIARAKDKNTNSQDKKTAEASIEMANKKFAEIAMIQEQMKGFPNGMPESLAAYLPDTSMMGSELPQAKRGGYYKNGGNYLPKAQVGEYYNMVTGKRYKPVNKNPNFDYVRGQMKGAVDYLDPEQNPYQIKIVKDPNFQNPSVYNTTSNKSSSTSNPKTSSSTSKNYNNWRGKDWKKPTFTYEGKTYNVPKGLTPEQFYADEEVIEYLKRKQIFPKAIDDGVWGPEHQEAYEKIYLNNQPEIDYNDLDDPEGETVSKAADKTTENKENRDLTAEGDNTPVGYNNKYSGYKPDDLAMAAALARGVLFNRIAQPVAQSIDPVQLRVEQAKYDRNPIDAQIFRGATEAFGSLSPQIAAAVTSNYLGRGSEAINQGLAQTELANLQNRQGVYNQQALVNSQIDAQNQQLNRQYNVDTANYFDAQNNMGKKAISDIAGTWAQVQQNDYLGNLLGTSGLLNNYGIGADGNIFYIPTKETMNKKGSGALGFGDQIGQFATLAEKYGISVSDVASAFKALSQK